MTHAEFVRVELAGDKVSIVNKLHVCAVVEEKGHFKIHLSSGDTLEAKKVTALEKLLMTVE